MPSDAVDFPISIMSHVPQRAAYQRMMAVLGFTLLSFTLAGCAPAVSTVATMSPPCSAATVANGGVRWVAPTSPPEIERSRAGCESVGPAVLRRAQSRRAAAPGGTLFVVSWNVATGRADVQQLIGELADDERRAHRPEPDFILLLQETFRSGGARGEGARGAGDPRRVGRLPRQHVDVLSLAEHYDLNLVYVPSMRHRTAARDAAADDRGNAILSTLPLRDIAAIELPFVRQRRVAVVGGVDVGGVRLTVTSVHLSPRRRFLRGWLFSGPFSRERQAAALVDGLALMRPGGPIIVGGDFNTIAGAREPAIRRMEQRFGRIECGSPLTHRWGGPLDYLFASDASIVRSCCRAGKRYGSDHHALVARVARPLPSARAAAPRPRARWAAPRG